MASMPNIQSIVFDLGVVLIDLDQTATQKAFAQLNRNPNLTTQTLLQDSIFQAFETGHCTETEFLDFLRYQLQAESSDEALRQAWNAMLLSIPAQRIQLLERLAPEYALFLLSNTNRTHLEHIQRQVQNQHSLSGLEDLFNQTFYSHLLHLRKPDPKIYAAVTELAGLDPHRTLFIDDNLQNIIAARDFGWQGIHLSPGQEVGTMLPAVLSGSLPIR